MHSENPLFSTGEESVAALKYFVLDMAAYGSPINDFTTFMQLANERVGAGNVNADEFLMHTVKKGRKTGVYFSTTGNRLEEIRNDKNGLLGDLQRRGFSGYQVECFLSCIKLSQ
jgi:hypothetical protein